MPNRRILAKAGEARWAGEMFSRQPAIYLTGGVLAALWGSAWGLGGRASFVPPFLFLLGVGVGLAACWHVLGRWRRRSWKKAQRGASPCAERSPAVALSAGAAVFLLLQSGWALAHPLYREVTLRTGRVVLDPLGDRSGWLPVVMTAERSLPFVLVSAGALLFALSLLSGALSRGAIRRIFMLVYANAVVLAVVGIALKLSGETRILGLFEPVSQLTFASFRYHNHWAAFALLALGLGAGLANRARLRERGSRRRTEPLYWLGNGLLLLSLPLSTSRSGMLLGAGLLAVFLFPRFREAWRTSRSRPALAVFAVIIAALLVSTVFPLVQADIDRRWAQTQKQVFTAATTDTAAGVPDRIRFVEGPALSTAMWADRPWFGWGPGSFYRLFPEYAGASFFDARGRLIYLEYAHTDYFQMLAEWGLIGALGFFLFWAGLWWAARAPDPRHPLIGGVWQGLGAVALLAVWEFPFGNPAVLLHAVLLAALAATYVKAADGFIRTLPAN